VENDGHHEKFCLFSFFLNTNHQTKQALTMGKKKSKTKAAKQQQQEEEEEEELHQHNDKETTANVSKDDGNLIRGESSKGATRKVKITTTARTATTKKPVDDEDSAAIKPSEDITKKDVDDGGATELIQASDETKKRPSSSSTTKVVAKKAKATTTTTKRQRLRQVNETNRWTMPSPRIQTVEGRAKASIRIAGLSANQKLQHSKNSNLLSPALDLHSPEVKFGRLLGSVDERVRHQAVVQLRAYLKARCAIVDDNNISRNDEEQESSSSHTAGLSEMDLLKLWKALWYTLYMADKVPVQEALSETIASLLWCVAGTEEEDEYAAQVYLRMCEEPFDDDDDEEGEEDDDHLEDDDDDDDDVEGEDFTLEEVVNTLDGKDNTESDSDCSDGNGSSSDEMDTDNQDHNNDDNNDQENEDDDIDDSEILHCRGAHLASLLIRTFFQTIRREWGRMDKYRVDKFYTLVRLVMHEVFAYMAKRHWHQGIIRLFNDAIYEQVLRETPNGLRYHVIDVTLHELAKVNANAKHCPMPLTEATLLEVLEPYFAMAQTGAGGDDSVQARVLENILTKFLTHYSVARTETPPYEEDKGGAEEKKQGHDNNNSNTSSSCNSLVMDNVHVGTIGQYLFTIASDTDTLDKYRKSLYDLHKRYVRRLNEPGVKDVNIQADMDDDEEEEEEEDEQEPETASGKKMADHDVMEVVEMTAEARYDADVDTPERPARNVIKKKKKKSKAGAKAVAGEEMVAQDEIEDESVVVEKKKKSSKRSIEKVVSNEEEDEEADQGAEADNDTAEDDATKEKKKRKKNERTREAAAAASEEEEVTISLQEQATAKAFLLSASKREHEHVVSTAAKQKQQEKEQHQSKDKKTKKSPKSRDQDAVAAEAAARQVKFAPVNHARSWKASMKGLLTMTPKIQPSPERGLLKKKSASTNKKTTKPANRKKAIDYF
jgi:Nucleolar protein,Nop52